MTTLSNTEMINNVVAILEHIKNNDELDNHDNFKSLMNKVTTAAMKGNKMIVVKQKKDMSTPYTDFVKAKMSEVKDLPKDQKFKRIGEMWKAYKAANGNEPKAVKAVKSPKEPKAVKEPKEPKEPKAVKAPKEPKAPKAPKKTAVVDSSDDDA